MQALAYAPAAVNVPVPVSLPLHSIIGPWELRPDLHLQMTGPLFCASSLHCSAAPQQFPVCPAAVQPLAPGRPDPLGLVTDVAGGLQPVLVPPEEVALGERDGLPCSQRRDGCNSHLFILVEVGPGGGGVAQGLGRWLC